MADDQSAASAPDAQAGTPPEQPTPAAPAAAPEPRNDPQLVTAYTQATQLTSAVRTALGLPREAGTTQVLDAIAALKTRQAESEPVDPRIARDMQRANEAMWRAQTAIYGEPFVTAARSLMDEAQTLRDPEEFSNRLASLVQSQSQQSAAAAPPPLEQPAAPQPARPDLSLGNEPQPRVTVELSADEVRAMRLNGTTGPQDWFERVVLRKRSPQT